jgi:hypothetical protein
MISELISSDSQSIVVAVSDGSDTWLEWWGVDVRGGVYRWTGLDLCISAAAEKGDMDDIPF